MSEHAVPSRSRFPVVVRRALDDLEQAEKGPTTNQVRGLALLAVPVFLVVAVVVLLASAVMGFKGKKVLAGIAAAMGVAGLSGVALGATTAAKPELVVDPETQKVLDDPRSSLARSLRTIGERLDDARPALLQALLDSPATDEGPAFERLQAWKQDRERLQVLAEDLARSLSTVGPLGSLGKDDGGARLERARADLEALERGRTEAKLRAKANAEVDALDRDAATPPPSTAAQPAEEIPTARRDPRQTQKVR